MRGTPAVALVLASLVVGSGVSRDQGPANRLRQGCGGPPKLYAKAEAGPYEKKAGRDEQVEGWRSLFDGATLGQWHVTEFGGEGQVTVENRQIVLGFGDPLTGITWKGEVPRLNYEIELQAMKLDGNDFFCGLTFPVRESSCSLILGGWGGGTVGLSTIDGADASRNETTQEMTFDKNRWYTVRVRVTGAAIDAWLDNQQIIAVKTAGRKISIRPEVDLSQPLGIAAYHTRAALRSVRIRDLP